MRLIVEGRIGRGSRSKVSSTAATHQASKRPALAIASKRGDGAKNGQIARDNTLSKTDDKALQREDSDAALTEIGGGAGKRHEIGKFGVVFGEPAQQLEPTSRARQPDLQQVLRIPRRA